MDLKYNIDIASIIKDLKEFGAEVGRDLQKAVAQLAASTHAKTAELANEELVDTKQQFMDSLSFEEVAPDIWIVSVDESGLWIEEGLPNNFDMKPGLLKNAQTSKSGTRYKVIPFNYGRNPTQMTDKAHDLIDYLKSSLKKEKIPFRRIERNPDGSPKVGKLHVLDLGNPGGRMGSIGKGNTPIFSGLSIYQHKLPSGKVKKSIMTFRTVSSGPGSAGKWIHPGRVASKFLDRALEFCVNEFENQILPEILKKWD